MPSAAWRAERSLACRAQPGLPSAAWPAERSLTCRAANTATACLVPGAQDQHAAELRVYKQRLKHLLYEHAGAAARLAAQGEAALKEQVGGWRA